MGNYSINCYICNGESRKEISNSLTMNEMQIVKNSKSKKLMEIQVNEELQKEHIEVLTPSSYNSLVLPSFNKSKCIVNKIGSEGEPIELKFNNDEHHNLRANSKYFTKYEKNQIEQENNEADLTKSIENEDINFHNLNKEFLNQVYSSNIDIHNLESKSKIKCDSFKDFVQIILKESYSLDLFEQISIESGFGLINIEKIISEIEDSKFIKTCFKFEENQNKISANDSVVIKNLNEYYFYGFCDDQLNKQKHGLIISSDWIYFGEFSNDLRHGFGRNISYKNKEIYDGTFKNDLPEGNGKLKIINKDFYYEGNFSNGYQHLFGIELNKNTTYKGYFCYDIKQGLGFLSNNDILYLGEFYSNTLNGLAKITYQDGRTYQGEVVSFKFEGFGFFEWPDKKTYIGYYRNDKRNGFGIMLFPIGLKYEGFWVDGQMHGFGIETFNGISILKEYRFNKLLRNLYSITERIGDIGYQKLIDQINEYAVECFDYYQDIIIKLNSYVEELENLIGD